MLYIATMAFTKRKASSKYHNRSTLVKRILRLCLLTSWLTVIGHLWFAYDENDDGRNDNEFITFLDPLFGGQSETVDYASSKIVVDVGRKQHQRAINKHYVMEKNEQEGYTDTLLFETASCFKARTNTVSPSLHHNLPKPFINQGE